MKRLIILMLLPMAGFGFIIITSCRPAPQTYDVAMIFKCNLTTATSNVINHYVEAPMHPLIIPTFIKY